MQDKLEAKKQKMKQESKKTDAVPSDVGERTSKFSLGIVDTRAKIIEIPTDKIVKSFEYQARQNFDDELISKIAKSIENEGFLQNIIVVAEPNGNYQLVAGETRYKAAVKANLPTIPALTYPIGTSVEKLIRMSVLENYNRADVTNFELYSLFSTLIEEKKVITYSDIYDYFDGNFSLDRIKKIMAYKNVHPEILRNAKEGIYQSIDVIQLIRSMAKKLSKEKNISLERTYQDFILPVYRKIVENECGKREAKKMLNEIFAEKEKKSEEREKKVTKILKNKLIVESSDLEALTDEKKNSLVDMINKFIMDNK